MDVINCDPSLALVPVPFPALEPLQDDEAQRMDIRLVTRSVGDHTVVEVHQAVTFTDQPVLALVHPLDVALQTDLHLPEGVLQAILEGDMVVADLEVTPFAPAVLAHDPSLVHVHARCHIQATRDILEAAAVPDQSAGQEEATVAMTLGIVDLDHPKPEDMVSGKTLNVHIFLLLVQSRCIFSVCSKNIYDQSGMYVLLSSNC